DAAAALRLQQLARVVAAVAAASNDDDVHGVGAVQSRGGSAGTAASPARRAPRAASPSTISEVAARRAHRANTKPTSNARTVLTCQPTSNTYSSRPDSVAEKVVAICSATKVRRPVRAASRRSALVPARAVRAGGVVGAPGPSAVAPRSSCIISTLL